MKTFSTVFARDMIRLIILVGAMSACVCCIATIIMLAPKLPFYQHLDTWIFLALGAIYSGIRVIKIAFFRNLSRYKWPEWWPE